MKTTNAQINLKLDNKRPVLKAAFTKATFSTSLTLWSDSVATWSDLALLWGGSDPKQSLGPVLQNVGLPTTTGGSGRSGMPMGPGFFLYITYPN